MAQIVDAGGGGGYDYPIDHNAGSTLLINGYAPTDTTGWDVFNTTVIGGKFFMEASAVLDQIIMFPGYTPNALQFLAKYEFGTPPSTLQNAVKAVMELNVKYTDDTTDSFTVPVILQLVSVAGVYDVNIMCELDVEKVLEAITLRIQTLSLPGGLYVSAMVLQKSTGTVDNSTTVKPSILYALVNDDLTYTFEGDTLPSTEDFERVNYTPVTGDTVVVRKEGIKNIILGKKGDGTSGGATIDFQDKSILYGLDADKPKLR